MFRNKKGKDVRLRSINIFEGYGKKNIVVSDHFLERWNERVGRIRFDTKEELEEYLRLNSNPNDIEHLYGDHYFIKNIMGGIYVVAEETNNGILLITTFGTYKNNPVILNVILSGELNKTLKKYGKMNTVFTV
ncbi:MAG: hypothetical protein M0Q88_05900 [Bacilli bacterium]|nr:hypothetical protein [Bacilli bacterium]